MSRTLNLGFAGTPEFAKVALEALLAAGYPVKLVLTQPDRPSGRGMKLTASPVKASALQHHIPVLQPLSLKKGEDGLHALQQIRSVCDGKPLDLLIVAAYGLILPQAVLDAPRLGCLNIHASLLPRWRGAAPIQRAIEAGDTATGVCIMQMEAGLDTGPVRSTHELAITDDDTASTLHDKLAKLGGRALVEALDALVLGKLPLSPQPEHGVTYAEKISKSEGLIDWQRPAIVLQRQLRAFDPFPGCHTVVDQTAVKCFSPSLAHGFASSGQAGTVLAIDQGGVVVQCGQGALRIAQMQRPGAKRAPAQSVAQALGLQTGHHLG